jgi:hypothetical protein
VRRWWRWRGRLLKLFFFEGVEFFADMRGVGASSTAPNAPPPTTAAGIVAPGVPADGGGGSSSSSSDEDEAWGREVCRRTAGCRSVACAP